VGTAAAVLFAQGIPVFADSDRDNYCIDPKALEAAITPRTRAVVLCISELQMADLDAILAIARRHDLLVIEDLRARAWRRVARARAGSLGELRLFQHANLQASDGRRRRHDPHVKRPIRRALRIPSSNCGRPSLTDRYKHRSIGHNYRMTEFQTALLLAQLERLPEQTERRWRNARLLASKLEGIPGIRPLPWDPRITRPGDLSLPSPIRPGGFAGAHRDVSQGGADDEARSIPS